MYTGNESGKQIGQRGQETLYFQRQRNDKFSWEEIHNVFNPHHATIMSELLAI